MRPWIICIAVATLCSGCTNLALERTTVRQASTLSDLQYQQVLDNLALFACNPDALAWQLKLNSGSVQVTDQGTVGLMGNAGGTGSLANSITPSSNAVRGIVGQWNVVPAVEVEDLTSLQLAYHKAVFPLDETGTIREAIYEQIRQLTVKYDVLLARETVDKLLDHAKPKNNETADEFQTRIWDLRRKLHKMYEIFDDQLDQLIKITEETQNQLKSPIDVPSRAAIQRKALDQKNDILQLRGGIGDQITNLVREIGDLPYIPRYPITGTRNEHNVAVIGQVQNKIKALADLAKEPEYATPWLCFGKRKDVPKCVCYVGHYCNCGRDCYVWVRPENRAILRDFTLAVLSLAPLPSQEIPGMFPGGTIAYSPTTAGGPLR